MNLGYAPAMMNYGYMCASEDGIRKNLDDGLFWLLSAIENGEDGAMEYLTKYYKQNRRGEWVKSCFHSIGGYTMFTQNNKGRGCAGRYLKASSGLPSKV